MTENNEVKVSKIKKDPEKKKQKKVKDSSSTNWMVILIIGILSIGLAFGAFFLLLDQEKKVLDSGEKVSVYTLAGDVAEGTKLTEDLVSQVLLPAETTPANAINLTDIKFDGSMYFTISANKNTVLTPNMLANVAETGTKEVGVATGSLAMAINGILRASDYIDIYIIPNDFDPSEPTYVEESYEVTDVNADTGETSTHTETTMVESGTYIKDYSIEPTFKQVFVSKVFDSNGAAISNADTTSIVNNFNIVLDDADANYLIGALQTGKVYIAKCTKPDVNQKYISNIPSADELTVSENNFIEMPSEEIEITDEIEEVEESEE